MKILLSDSTEAYLYPGGKQVHAEKLYKYLKVENINVELENWYDPKLEGDIIHFFGFSNYDKIRWLKHKGYKLVYTHILDWITNKSNLIKNYHTFKNKAINYLPNKFNPLFPWKALKYFDAIVYMHEQDRQTSIKVYGIDPKKTYVIPHAVDSIGDFNNTIKVSNEKYLISVGSIVPRKNSLFTAKLCRDKGIKIKFIGYPFNEKSNYYKSFLSSIDNEHVQYLGYLSEAEKINVLQGASGFVLLSLGESGCISVYEAAAYGLPLLLSDLPWAKSYADPVSIDFADVKNYQVAGNKLLEFYKKAQRLDKPSFSVHTWNEIAKMYIKIYNLIR